MYELQHKVHLFKTACVGFFIKVYFLFKKMHRLINFKMSYFLSKLSFENVSIVTFKQLFDIALLNEIFLFLTYFFFNWIKNIPLRNNLFISLAFLIRKVKYCKPQNSLINGIFVVLLKGLAVRTTLYSSSLLPKDHVHIFILLQFQEVP